MAALPNRAAGKRVPEFREEKPRRSLLPVEVSNPKG
jgi:hypothetical protein